MTGNRALYHYNEALVAAKKAVKRLEEAPASAAQGKCSAEECVNLVLESVEFSLKQSLTHVGRLIKRKKP